MKRKVLAIACLGAVSILAWFLISGGGDPSTSATDVNEPAPEPVAVAPSVPPPVAPSATPSAPTPASEAAPARQDRKQKDEPRDYVFAPEDEEQAVQLANDRRELTGRASAEKRDAKWSAETAARVQGLLAQTATGVAALKEVDCRETICRFALRSATSQRKDVKELLKAARAIDEQTWTLPEAQGDGSFAIEVFFPRENYRLSGGGGRIDQPPHIAELGRP